MFAFERAVDLTRRRQRQDVSPAPTAEQVRGLGERARAGRKGRVQFVAADGKRLAGLFVIRLRESNAGWCSDRGGKMRLAGIAPVLDIRVEIGVEGVGESTEAQVVFASVL